MNMQTCWVNSEDPPKEIIHHGIWRHDKHHDKDDYASELVTYVYPHPDAPEHAVVHLLIWDTPIRIKDQVVIGQLEVQTKTTKATNQLIQTCPSLQKKPLVDTLPENLREEWEVRAAEVSQGDELILQDENE